MCILARVAGVLDEQQVLGLVRRELGILPEQVRQLQGAVARSGTEISAVSGDMTNSNSTSTVLTGGPTLVVPFDGDFEVALRLTMAISADSIAVATVHLDGVATECVLSGQSGQITPCGFGRVLGATSGQVLDVRCLNANSVSTRYVNAQISLRPLAVV